jgi:hypothetical protein
MADVVAKLTERRIWQQEEDIIEVSATTTADYEPERDDYQPMDTDLDDEEDRDIETDSEQLNEYSTEDEDCRESGDLICNVAIEGLQRHNSECSEKLEDALWTNVTERSDIVEVDAARQGDLGSYEEDYSAGPSHETRIISDDSIDVMNIFLGLPSLGSFNEQNIIANVTQMASNMPMLASTKFAFNSSHSRGWACRRRAQITHDGMRHKGVQRGVS